MVSGAVGLAAVLVFLLTLLASLSVHQQRTRAQPQSMYPWTFGF
jgi:hypothetical protein